MGREIRTVPADWVHPKDERTGRYKPLHDQSFREAAEEWVTGFEEWRTGTHKDFKKHGVDYPYFWQWEGDPPDEEYYRPDWPEETRTHFQVYETVSEGTPVSPVFATKGEIADWAVAQGHSREAADAFAEDGYVPSGLFIPGKGFAWNIDAAAHR